ncbi:hypothetical protein VPH35_119716 [Triticum aestivum]|uniref:Uncharacterized protein n=1 Tax=Triticum urartu TaxID=4572 RepID=A0A8R7QV77_TRIUA
MSVVPFLKSYFSPSLSSSVHNHHHHRRKFSWLQYSRPTDGGSKLTGYNCLQVRGVRTIASRGGATFSRFIPQGTNLDRAVY